MEYEQVDKLEKKSKELIAQLPKLNQLERDLEIQKNDDELKQISSQVSGLIGGTRALFQKANHETTTIIIQGTYMVTM